MESKRNLSKKIYYENNIKEGAFSGPKINSVLGDSSTQDVAVRERQFVRNAWLTLKRAGMSERLRELILKNGIHRRH